MTAETLRGNRLLSAHNHSSGYRINRCAGFVVTTTLTVVFSLVVVGLIVGIGPIVSALYKKKLFEDSVDVYVIYDEDNNPATQNSVLGKAVDLDHTETPLIPFVDYGVAGTEKNYRVLIGVRDDRFTSANRVYYTSEDCYQGPARAGETAPHFACIFIPGFIEQDHRLSFQTAVQASGRTEMNYAVGRNQQQPTGQPGELLRQMTDSEAISLSAPGNSASCPINPFNRVELKSYWKSDSLTPIDSCVRQSFEVTTEEVPRIFCKSTPGNGSNCTTTGPYPCDHQFTDSSSPQLDNTYTGIDGSRAPDGCHLYRLRLIGHRFVITRPPVGILRDGLPGEFESPISPAANAHYSG